MVSANSRNRRVPSSSCSCPQSPPRPADQNSQSSNRFSCPTVHTVSTERGLQNAAPSPQPEPSAGTSQPPLTNTESESLESVTSGVLDLTVQSIETPSTDSDEDDSEDPEMESASEESDEDESQDAELDFGSGESDDDSTYSVREEELPPAPIYDVRLQNSLSEVRSRLAKLAISMRRAEIARDETTDINGLYKRALTMSKFEYPETRIVGFIGNSGAGKSTLINSLLDKAGLARSSGNGNACTSVVTEFRQIDEAHPRPYTIEADFMTIEEQEELLQELLRAYRMRHTAAWEEVTDREERERITSLSLRAWETLESLFPHQKEMTEEFLSDEECHTEAKILIRLKEWARAGLQHQPGGPDALHYRIEAADVNDCADNLDTLTVISREPGRPAIWPFVKLIRVYLRSPVLRTGLVVADLPGFRDLNYARVRAAERYLRHVCDEVFIVEQIGRCRSDTSVEEIRERLIHDQPLRIVCTQSELGLNAGEIIRDREMPETVRLQTGQLSDQIQQAKRSLATLTIRRRRSSGVEENRLALKQTIAGDEVERLNFELKSLLMGARNELVTTDLTNHGEQTTEYIRLSGIPELRRYCQSVPAEAQLRATTTFLTTRVPALLGSLNVWVLAGTNSVPVERAATLRRVLDEAQRTLQSRLVSRHSCIRSTEADLAAQFRDCVVDCINDSQGRWTAGAIAASQSWRRMHHSTYAAFCRKYGVHAPRGGSLRCWNKEIVALARAELRGGWETLRKWLAKEAEALEAEVNEIFDTVSESIEEHEHLAPETIENLLDNLNHQKDGVIDTVQRTFELITSSHLKISRDALDGHSSVSHIAEIMHPAYSYCKSESGTGSDARRKNYMEEHVRDEQIFKQLSKKIKARCTRMTAGAFDFLKENLADEVQNINKDLAAAVAAEGEPTEAGREPALAERVRAAVANLQTRLKEAHLILDRLQEGPGGV